MTRDGIATNQGRVRDLLSWSDYEYALRPISTLQQPPNPLQSRRRRRPEYLPLSHVTPAQSSPGGTPYMYGGPYGVAPPHPVLVQQQRLDRGPCHVTMGPHAGQYIMQAPISGVPLARGTIPCVPKVQLNGVVNQTTVASATRAYATSQDQSHDDEVLQEMQQLLYEAADIYTTPSHDTSGHSSTGGHREVWSIHEYLVDVKDLPPRSSNETVIDTSLTDSPPDAEGGKVTSNEDELVPTVSQGVVEATSPSQQSFYDFGECPAWLTDLLEADDEKTVPSVTTDELPLPDPNAIEELLALMDEVKSPASDSLIARETNDLSTLAREVENTATRPNNKYKFSLADCSTLEELLAPADEVSTTAEPVNSQQVSKAEPDDNPLPDPRSMRELLALADEVSTAAGGRTVPVGSQQVSDAAQEEAPLPDPSTMQEILSHVGEVTSAVENGDSSSNASCVEYIEVIEEGIVPPFTTPPVYQSPTGPAQVWFSPYTCTYMNMSAELAAVFPHSVAPWPLNSTSVQEMTSRKRRCSKKINEEKTKRRRTVDKCGAPQ
ncbi:uncharacterized protein LOC116610252 [Nematostella vectensis]|uniref:uncharacterized protein LOC116610252 n=1 Tax=Nematostella vectensis TaxID=45351 RepID=UPI0020776858|nr:uncharacterized protein LOC116610252 [Nematostella vectensis]